MTKVLGRKRRGQTTEKDNRLFNDLSAVELINLLTDNNSQKRTSAAKLLGNRQCVLAIVALCRQLKQEKALYCKIAISQALSRIGKPAIAELIKLLGKIGKNQHTGLPLTIFKKWNYPYPRDVAARTIAQIGLGALLFLQRVLKSNDKIATAEAIDAIGYISFYSGDQSSFPVLLESLDKYKSNQIMTWKIIRALQAFPSNKSIKVLEEFLSNSKIPALRWEAARSLGQIGTDRCKEVLEKAVSGKPVLVKKMISRSIVKIRRN